MWHRLIFITRQVTHALTVGDPFALQIRAATATDFRKLNNIREEISEPMAAGEALADLEAEVESYSANDPIRRAQVDG